jgi:hypothetical protein
MSVKVSELCFWWCYCCDVVLCVFWAAFTDGAWIDLSMSFTNDELELVPELE